MRSAGGRRRGDARSGTVRVRGVAPIIVVAAVLASSACVPTVTVDRDVIRPSTATSTSAPSTADRPQAHSGHLRPVPVLFGDDAVRVADGSGSYVDVTPAHEPNEYVYDAFFVDRDHGWVGFNDSAAAAGRLVRTDDGGRTWEATNLTARVHQSAGSRGWIRFIDRRYGWVATYAASAPAGGLYRTTDGGRTWSDWADEPEPGPVRFETAGHGWLSTYYFTGPSHLYETIDGGSTWNRRTVPPPEGRVEDDLAYRFPLFEGRRGVLPLSVGEDRVAFYASDDNGQNWRPVSTVDVKGGPKAAVIAASLGVWWAIGSDGTPAAVTADGGRTWTTRHRSGLPNTILELEAQDDRTAWATAFDQGGPLRLYATHDGGDTWQPISGDEPAPKG